MKSRILFLVCIAFLLPLQGFGKEPKGSAEYAEIRLDESTFNAATRCGECHIDIYELWSRSLHSRALTDPAFLAVFNDPRVQQDDLNRKHCLQCHAPTLHYNPELDLTSDIVQEGVTCDFCHSIEQVDLDNFRKPFSVKWGKTKQGPHKDSQSPVHETRQSDLFEKSELCGGCHEMRNLKNTPIITTYSEWKEAYYEKIGKASCQDCHMPLGFGFTVSSKHRKQKRRINLHSFPGGHSRVQLHDALELRLLEEMRFYNKMKVKLGVTNVGVGHSFPTGNPLRKVVVLFRAFSAFDELIYEETVELWKQFVDNEGRLVTNDIDILLDAARVLKDNRIAPGETKELSFEFISRNEKLLIEATVLYVYGGPPGSDQDRQEPLISFTKVVNKRVRD